MLIVYNAVVLRKIKVKPFKIFSLQRLPRQKQDQPKLCPKSGPIFPCKEEEIISFQELFI